MKDLEEGATNRVEEQEAERHLHQQELSVFARLQRMGGRANEASFGLKEVSALKELIGRGIVRRVGRFEVEIVPDADLVHKTDTSHKPTEAHSADLVAQSARKDNTVAPTSPPSTPGPSQSQPVKATFQLRKLSFRKLGRLRPDRIRGLAARIVERLQCLGPQVRARTLERSLHADRFPEWEDAVAFLAARRLITITEGIVTLVDPMADEKLPDPYPQQKVRKKRRRRPRTEWFEARLRHAEELGVPVNDIIELDRGGTRLLG